MSQEATNVVSHDNFKQRRLTKIANKFVEIYEEDELEAAAYAKRAVRESEYPLLRTYITNAFIRNGWDFE